jgi:hypothetical protein
LATRQVMLGAAGEKYLPAAAREHRGAGVTVYIRLPPALDIGTGHARQAAAGVVTEPLGLRPWGERAFDAQIAGYRFLIAQDAGPESESESPE